MTESIYLAVKSCKQPIEVKLKENVSKISIIIEYVNVYGVDFCGYSYYYSTAERKLRDTSINDMIQWNNTIKVLEHSHKLKSGV